MTHKCTPYGYTYHVDHLEIHPEEAEVVRRPAPILARHYAHRPPAVGRGNPTRSDSGGGISPKIRNRGVWAPSTVNRILRSTTYIGPLAWNKRHFVEPDEAKRRKPRNDKRPQSTYRYNPKDAWIETPCPAIIDQDTWARVQDPLDHGKSMANNAGRKHEYLFLNGRLRCGRCGYAMSGFYDGKKRARFYRCSGVRHDATIKCWHTIRAEPLEEHTWGVIHEGLLSEPEYLAVELERRQALVDQQSGVTSHDVELIEGKMQDCERRLQRWKEAYARETINLDEFSQLKQELDVEMAALTRLRDELNVKLSTYRHKHEEIAAAVEFVRRVRDELPTYTIAERRQVIELLDVRVVYTDQDHMPMYFMIPAKSDIDPREIWPGDAFAEQWGYVKHPLSPYKLGRG